MTERICRIYKMNAGRWLPQVLSHFPFLSLPSSLTFSDALRVLVTSRFDAATRVVPFPLSNVHDHG